MSLRLKIICITTFGFLALSAAVFFFANFTVEKAFNEFELESLDTTAALITNAYQSELKELASLAGEFAKRSETGNLVSGTDIAQSAISDNELATRRVSFAAIVDSQGALRFTRQIDLDKLEPVTPTSEALRAFINNDNHLRLHPHAESVIKGLALVNEKPIIAVSVPILPEKEGELLRGAVILARTWETSQFVELANNNGLSVFHQSVSDGLAADMKTYYNSVDGSVGQTQTLPLGQSSIASYTVLEDVYGKPSLVVRLSKNRGAASAAPACAMRVGLFGLGFGLFIFLLMLGLLEVGVLHRLRVLTREVRHLKSTERIADAVVTVRGKDEVGKLAHGMRYVLDAMKANRFRWMRAEKRLQELLELSPMGILLAEPVNHRLYRVNDAALRILGARRTDLTGKGVTDVFKSVNGTNDIRKMQEQIGDEIRQVPAIVCRGDGTEMRVNVKAGSIRQTEGELIIFAFVPANGEDHNY